MEPVASAATANAYSRPVSGGHERQLPSRSSSHRSREDMRTTVARVGVASKVGNEISNLGADTLV